MMVISRRLKLALTLFWIFIFSSTVSSLTTLASPLEPEQRLNFDYETELSFIFWDALSPSNFSQSINQDAAPAARTSSRTLGLRRSVIDLHWSHIGTSEFRLRLRPDATLQRHVTPQTEYREIDSRAGRVYRSAPAVQLLDTYELSIVPGDDFRIGWGVFEGFEPNRAAYDSSLEFGLEARLPQKFAAYYLSWTMKPIDLPRLGPGLQKGYRFTFWAFEGREDRRELLGTQPQTADIGPVARDPYIGGAISMEAFPVENWRYSITAGYGDTKVEFGRVTEIFSSVAVDWQTTLAKRTTRFHWQSHWARELWRISQGRLTGLQQLSHSLTARNQLSKNWQLLLGGHRGTGEHHREIDFSERAVESGHQYDLGVEFQQGSFLTYQLLLATEVRASTADGQRQGGFNIDGEQQRQLNRLGFAVSYRIL